MSLNKKGFFIMTTALTICSLGDTFGLLALEWMVYLLTGSKLSMGTLALCRGIPEVAGRLVGAPLIDRIDKGRLLIGLNVIRFTAIAVPVSCAFFDALQLWHLYVAAIITGLCNALFDPAALAIVPMLTEKNRLVKSYAILDGFRSGASLVGPILAGSMIAIIGVDYTLAINAACYLLSAAFICFLPLKSHKREQVVVKDSSYLSEIVEGLSFFKQYPPMLVIMILVAISNMCSMAVWTMMVPFVQDTLQKDASGMGLLGTSVSIGTLVALFILSLIGDVKKRRIPMLGSLICIGLLYVVLGSSSNFQTALVVSVLLGLAGPFFSSFSTALFGGLVSDGMRGRVMAVRYLVGGSLAPLGGFLGGAVAQELGVPFMFSLAGLLPLAAGLSGCFIPLLKELDGEISEVASRKRGTKSKHTVST
ncbi:MFS transporter [Brevibacillus choshinensis]|uniref:MFS transporter n=1 Tax=Brevibacillus choshinensis TaxID=54911 RepID=UPI002E23EBF4|nr:MFS transporter [Brevibacillus choshinensis]